MMALMVEQLLTSRDVDRLLRYSSGKAVRLAKAGRLPHIVLPDGAIRFREMDLRSILDGQIAGGVRLSERGTQ